MVLGHEGVFCWGGPEQRAVHKGCGMERLAGGGTGETTSLTKQPRARLHERVPLRLVLIEQARINLKDICGYIEADKPRVCGTNILNVPTVE